MIAGTRSVVGEGRSKELGRANKTQMAPAPRGKQEPDGGFARARKRALKL